MLFEASKKLSSTEIDNYLTLKMKNDAVKKVHQILTASIHLHNGDKIAFIALCLLLEVTY